AVVERLDGADFADEAREHDSMVHDSEMRVALALLFLAALKPPVIHESFTPLPCPKHASSTLALEGCAEKAILAGDRKIDAKAHAIFFKLAPRERAGFVR